MKKRIILPMTLLAIVFFSFRRVGVVGTMFPDLAGVTLSDKQVSLPNDTKGKSTIIAIAYSEDAEQELKTWTDPAYDKFIAKNELMPYDVNLYFVPIFSGAKAALADAAKNKFKNEVDKELHPYVLIYRGDLDKYKSALQMDRKNSPYIFVLDKDGKIVYSTSGIYTEEKMDAIEDNLD